jgi:hypothetical protein
MPQADTTLTPNAGTIWAAVSQGRHHLLDDSALNGVTFQIVYSDYSAHGINDRPISSPTTLFLLTYVSSLLTACNHFAIFKSHQHSKSSTRYYT